MLKNSRSLTQQEVISLAYFSLLLIFHFTSKTNSQERCGFIVSLLALSDFPLPGKLRTRER